MNFGEICGMLYVVIHMSRCEWGLSMSKMELIVMLTHNDYTVADAIEVFEACKHTPVHYWGAKEQGLPPHELKRLFAAIKENGKSAVLEVVAYSEDACLNGAKMAVECGCDMLLGTNYYDSVNELCRANGIRYMPFVGHVSSRPSILEGAAEDMIAEAKRYTSNGAYGVDLLGYRYLGNSRALCQAFVSSCDLPVCLAGSIDSKARLDEVLALRPAYFTIGGAFFDHCFGRDIGEQIAFVCDYINEKRKDL